MVACAFLSLGLHRKFIRGWWRMSEIETRMFSYFVALAEERHFAHAALRLGISPATLSRQINELESRLGVKLLERKGNRQVVVTAAGQRFLDSAREVLRRIDEIPAIARQAARGELGCLELAFELTSAALLHDWIAPFQKAYPAIDITLHHLSPMAQLTGIMRKELDVGFARPPHKYPSGVRGFDICSDPLVLALPREHPLARHNAIRPATLAREAFVGSPPEPELGFFGHLDAVARLGNFIPRVVKRDEDLMTVLAYVSLGHGIAVVPQLITRMDFADVVFRNIAADPMPQTSIAFVHSSRPSPCAKLLIAHMQGQPFKDIGSERSEPGPDQEAPDPATAVEPAGEGPDSDPDHPNGRVIDFISRKQE
jgi:DNA-binding transcriptional LysR family regulator